MMLVCVGSAPAAPGWTLDYKSGGLKRILARDARGRMSANYYVVYSVTNNSGEAVPFRVNFHVMTDTKKKSRDIGHARVEKKIEQRMGKKLVSRSERPKTIAAGETVECLAIFGAIDPRADEIWIDVVGLKDTIVTKSGTDFFEKKALRAIYLRPGDEFGADRDRLKLKKKESWVVLSGPTAVR